ncbi:MAG: hypothetical protein ABIA75_00810, partial [Candidatus Neomarinimicrobiota bacterium]
TEPGRIIYEPQAGETIIPGQHEPIHVVVPFGEVRVGYRTVLRCHWETGANEGGRFFEAIGVFDAHGPMLSREVVVRHPASRPLHGTLLGEGEYERSEEAEQVIQRWTFGPQPAPSKDADNHEITIIYKTFGPATKSLSDKNNDEIIDLIGPLGNTFSGYEENSHLPILVGGGVGLAPILWLHQKLKQSKIKHILIIGAQTADEHFIADNPQENIYLTTDDGTLGLRGTVMPVLNRLLGEITNPSIFACGPLAMLKAIQAVAVIDRVPAQLSVESYMACGLGLCQGCAIPLATDNNSRNYSLVCRDGPVYAAEEVSFA